MKKHILSLLIFSSLNSFAMGTQTQLSETPDQYLSERISKTFAFICEVVVDSRDKVTLLSDYFADELSLMYNRPVRKLFANYGSNEVKDEMVSYRQILRRLETTIGTAEIVPNKKNLDSYDKNKNEFCSNYSDK